MQRLKFGIIGAGIIGPTHAEAISEIDDAELVAVATSREETARPLAEKYGVKWYSNYMQLLDGDLDIVCICTPPYLHREMTRVAAEKRKHILVEKPIAIDLEDADAMIEVCERCNVKLGVVYQNRFKESLQMVKGALDNARFGKLILLDVYHKVYRTDQYYQNAPWRGTWEGEGGGVLINQAIHSIDLLQWFGGDVDEISGYIREGTTHNIETDDVAVACVKFADGVIGVIEGSTSTRPGFPRRLEIYGEKGTVILSGDDIVVWDFIEKKASDDEVIKNLGKSGSKSKEGSTPYSSTSKYHRLQIEDFISAVRKNKSPFIDGHEGRKSLEIVQAIYESARTGRAVKIK